MQDGSLVVFNTVSGIVKSDTAISLNLRSRLGSLFELFSQQAFRSNDEPVVMNIVDLSLFPLIYGLRSVETYL